MAQLVEHDLAKVGAAGSSPVSRFFYALILQDFSNVSDQKVIKKVIRHMFDLKS